MIVFVFVFACVCVQVEEAPIQTVGDLAAVLDLADHEAHGGPADRT